MRKFYFLVAAAMSAMTLAQAQTVVSEDYDIVDTWDMSNEYEAGGLTLVGATATVKYFSLNIGGLPKSYAKDGSWHPVTLSNGGVVKFFDEPRFDYPTAENFEETDALTDFDWSWDDVTGYSSSAAAIDNDWVVEGEGNEIYLDSYCNFGGTITGRGELTIYVGDRSTLSFKCGNVQNKVDSAFVGTIYIKPLAGYTCDTIRVTSSFAPARYRVGTLPNKTYAGSSSIFDITAFGGNIVWSQVGANSLVYPPIRGKGVIHTSNYPYFNGATDTEGNPVIFEYDATIEISGSETHDFEVYGNSLAFNAPIKGTQNHLYVRSASEIYFNSPEASGSGFLNGISQRGTGITGGTGWADIDYSPNGGRANVLSPGYPYKEVSSMIWKNIWVYSNNAVRFDFDNEGHADILALTGKFTMYAGQNEVQIGLPDNFQPKAGKYKVINGTIDAGLSSYVDTIGYEVWDNNGPAYVIRSVKGGEVIKLADGTNDEYVAKPGDSIGVASFGQLAGTYGATIMDGNRPYYQIMKWGAGSYSNGESVDDTEYKNTESPTLYKPNPEQIGTAAFDPDSTKWKAVWEQFLADHPCSNAWEPVETTDASVIPGTVTDSIFLTYSLYHAEEGIVGHHAWSWKNGSGSLCDTKGYPWANPITYSYFYYSNNTVRLQSGATSNYITDGDTTAIVSFAQRAFPIALTQNYDSIVSKKDTVWVEVEGVKTDEIARVDTTWSFKTDTLGYRYYTEWSNKIPQGTAGDSLQYRFNLKNYISDGIIAIETQLTKANGEVEQTLPAEENSEEIVNNDDILEIGTLAKESRIVANREIFSLDGLRVKNAGRGVNIVRTVFNDGTIQTKRVIIR